jgi:hypothetical protein
MARPEELQTYTRTINTMTEILDELRDQPDPDGTLTVLSDRIAVEREWVRALLGLGESPRRPPGWLLRRSGNPLAIERGV